MTGAILLSIQAGLPRTMGVEDAADPMDRLWTSGFVKEPVSGAVQVYRTHLAGDGQADLENHGGRDKALLGYSGDHYPYWRVDLGLPQLPYGAFGENLTIGGQTEADVCIGDVWTVGDVRLEISQPRQPCWKLARRWRIKDLALRVQRNGRSGWYFRVLKEGPIAAGQAMLLAARPRPRWTVQLANQVMHHEPDNAAAAAELADVEELSEVWRSHLRRRIAGR